MRSIIFIFLVFISNFCFSQKKQKISFKKQNLVLKDSCQILKQILKTKLVYHKIGNYYHDSTGLFFNFTFNLYPSFKRCVLNKDTFEIKKMFGEPSLTNYKNYTYYLLPYDDRTNYEKYITIIFDNSWIVKEIKSGGWLRDND